MLTSNIINNNNNDNDYADDDEEKWLKVGKHEALTNIVVIFTFGNTRWDARRIYIY